MGSDLSTRLVIQSLNTSGQKPVCREEVFASYMNLQLQETEVLLLAIKSCGGSGLVKSRQVDSEIARVQMA